MKFEPMLAATLKVLAPCAWPKLASPKIDGFRCVVKDGTALSRNLKPIKNKFIQHVLGRRELDGLDGELCVGPPWEPQCWGRTASGVTRVEGTPDFTFHVFDDFSVHGHSFAYRIGNVEDRLEELRSARVEMIPHVTIDSSAGLRAYEEKCLEFGYEGVMLRCPKAGYKFGRATELEDTLWKVKRFMDREAVVLKVVEGMVNTNEAEVSELGRTKRSSKKDGMVPSGLVGMLWCRDLEDDEEYKVSPGRLTAAERRHYFQHPDEIVGKVITHRSFPYGAKDQDRFRNFQRFRPKEDQPRVVKRLRASAPV